MKCKKLEPRGKGEGWLSLSISHIPEPTLGLLHTLSHLLFAQQSSGLSIMILTLRGGKLRFREGHKLVQGHTVVRSRARLDSILSHYKAYVLPYLPDGLG